MGFFSGSNVSKADLLIDGEPSTHSSSKLSHGGKSGFYACRAASFPWYFSLPLTVMAALSSDCTSDHINPQTHSTLGLLGVKETEEYYSLLKHIFKGVLGLSGIICRPKSPSN